MIDRHETKAAAVAKETGWDIDSDADDRDWSGIGLGPVGQTRDSGALDRSNFQVIQEDLRERYPDDFDIASFNHWACGWIEEMIWNAGNADLRAAVQVWRDKLDSYPVADDEHYSELESDELADYLATEIPAVMNLQDPELPESVTAGMVAEKLQETGDVSRIDDVSESQITSAIASVLADLHRAEHTPPASQLQLVENVGRPMTEAPLAEQ